MLKYVLSLTFIGLSNAGAVESSQDPIQPPPQLSDGAQAKPLSQDETATGFSGKIDSFPDHDFGAGLILIPKLVRSSEIKYDKDSSEVTKNQSDSFGLGVSLSMKPKKWYGARAIAGLDFQSTRQVSFNNNLGTVESFEATAAAAYLQAGYQVWRFYGDIGINFPLDFRSEWSIYKVEVTPGARVNIGVEITSGLKVEYFYSFGSYGLREKVNIGPSRDIRIFQNSSGIVLKFGQ
jgi:hypothetical protein